MGAIPAPGKAICYMRLGYNLQFIPISLPLRGIVALYSLLPSIVPGMYYRWILLSPKEPKGKYWRRYIGCEVG